MTLSRRLRDVLRAYTDNDLAELIIRIGMFFLGVALLNVGFTNWYRFPVATDLMALVLVLLLYVAGLSLIVLSLLANQKVARFALVIPISAMIGLILNYMLFVRFTTGYGTDALAFLHYSALLVVQGHNPYLESMAPSLSMVTVPQWFVTPLETGGAYDRTPYPALSFLVFVPGVVAGLQDLRPFALIVHLLAVVLVYMKVAGPLRALAPLTLAFTPEVFDFTPGGVTDIFWVVPAVLMAVNLRNVPRAAFWFGVACSLKQTPFFLAPFLVIWLYRVSNAPTVGTRLVDPIRFFAISASVFVMFNLPFLLHSPGPWLTSMVGPLAAPQVAYGQGLSSLMQYGHVLVPPVFFTILALFVFTALAAALFFRFEAFQFCFWFFPALILFFTARSLHSYFVYWVPLAFVGLVAWFHATHSR